MPCNPASTVYRNQGCAYRSIIGPEERDRCLLDHLSRRYPHSSPEQWAANIKAGLVRLNNAIASGDTLLKAGMELLWLRPAWDEPVAPRWFGLLYEDDDLLAVAKPAGLPTLPGADFYESTLLRLVQRQRPQAAPLHRLGRWTSGLVLCAKTADARRALLQQWSGRQVGKRYRALVSGSPDWDSLTIDRPIGPVPHPLLGSVHAASTCGRPARSQVTVLERRDGCCLCDVAIDTGRPHQIRIHLAAAGYPLVGDPLYCAGGLPATDSVALPGDPGYHLHSGALSFLHPASGQAMLLECPAPPLLRTAAEPA